MANPYLHTRAPLPENAYGMHPVLWDFLRDYWQRPGASTAELKALWAKGGPAKALVDRPLFEAQQAALKNFYRQEYGLEMPTFIFDMKLPNQGRGVWRPGT